MYPNASNDGNSNDNFPDDGFLDDDFPYGSFGKKPVWSWEFVTVSGGLAAIMALRQQKNYADVSKKLLHNRFKLLD